MEEPRLHKPFLEGPTDTQNVDGSCQTVPWMHRKLKEGPADARKVGWAESVKNVSWTHKKVMKVDGMSRSERKVDSQSLDRMES